MKTHVLPIACIAALVAYIGFAGQSATLTISPKTIVENYRGWLTITLSGLPSGATAMLELAVDFDGDGSFDSEDIAYRFFPVTDGIASPVPESEIAGDSDRLANGTIAARIALWDNVRPVGNLLLRARGTWGAAVQSLTVTPLSTAQSVSGTLRDESGNPLLGIAWAESEDELSFWSTVSNANGTYTLYISEPGPIGVCGWRPGTIRKYDGGSAQEFDLGAGEHKTGVDLPFFDGDTAITGRIYDAATNRGIEGISIGADTEDSEGEEWESEAISDANGYYTLPVLAGGMAVDLYDLSQHQYVGSDEIHVTVPSEGLSNFDFPMQKANCYITGRVSRSDSGAGMPGLELDIMTEQTQEELDVLTFSVEDGRYGVGVVAGTWRVAIDEEELVYAMGLIPPAPQYVTIASGQTLENVDLVLRVPTASIQVTVIDNQQNPVSGVWVWINDENWNYLGGRETDDEGKCTLGVVAGTYHVGVDQNDLFDRGYAILSGQQVTLASGEVRALNFTPQPGILVSGTVTRQSDGSPIPQAGINAYSGTQTWVWLTRTDAEFNGSYRIVLPPGSYKLQAGANGYLQEFYNEKGVDWSSGDTVVLSEQSGPMTGVNFTLEQETTPVVSPDCNGDGFVDVNDLLIIRQYWHQNWPQGK